MDIDKAFPSKYLSASDLDDREFKMTIAGVELENISADEDKKPVVYFTKGKKGLVLNKTNMKVIKAAYGKNTDDWIDKEIILFSAMVEFRGEMKEGIRVKLPKPVKIPPQAAAASTSENPADGMSEDIPF